MNEPDGITEAISQTMHQVIRIASDAAALISKSYGSQLTVDEKNEDGFDPVTNVDRESDAFIRSELKRLFPEDKVLSEETEPDFSDYTGRVWMADPLDGTKEFVNGGKNFSVMIGLCVDGKPTLGSVVAPVTGVIYWAEKGKGAYRQEAPNSTPSKLSVSVRNTMSTTRLITSIPRGEVRKSDERIKMLVVAERIPGASIGLRAAMIAENKADAFINTNTRSCKWDTCASQIILEEAGGKFTDISGAPLDYLQPSVHWTRSFIGSNGLVHDQIVKAVDGIITELP